jgi:spore coat protein U-like protein
VSAYLTPACTVVGGNLAFGLYDPITVNGASGANATQSTTVNVTCTGGAPVVVTLDAGTHFATTRNMSDGSHVLAYSLYTDESNVTPWGDTGYAATIAGNGLNNTGSGVAQGLVVYGTILKGQLTSYTAASASQAIFTDVVVITANF